MKEIYIICMYYDDSEAEGKSMLFLGDFTEPIDLNEFIKNYFKKHKELKNLKGKEFYLKKYEKNDVKVIKHVVIPDEKKKTTVSQKKASAKYDRENTKQIVLKLNLNTDSKILERLESVENKQGYIKYLILQDIKK